MTNYKNVHHITAGAGAGKTTKLVEIISGLVAAGEDPIRMILTTYTDAAATELREKSKAKLPAEKAIRMNGAQMGTLHSVARRYVDRYWYLLGISPSVKPVSESMSMILMNRSLDGLVTGAQKALLDKYVTTFGLSDWDSNGLDYDFWKDTLITLFDKMRGYGFDKRSIPDFKTRTMNLLRNTFNPSGNQELFDKFTACAQDYLAWKPTVDTHVTDAGQKQYAKNCVQVAKILALDPFKTERQILKEIKDMKWGGDHTIPVKNPARGQYQDDINACKGKVAEAAKELAEGLVPVEFSLIFDVAELLFSILDKWTDAYDKIKKETGVIDFPDMEALFLRLLKEKEAVKEDIRASVDFLFVDEFQDSTPIQAQIYEILSGLVKQSWFVGDRKQAIYGFAGSDSGLIAELVASFPEPEEDASSLSKYKKDERGNSSQILDISRRSVPRLVHAANDIFIPAFASSPGTAKDVIDREFVELREWDEKKDTAWDPLYHIVCKPGPGKKTLNADALATFVCSMADDPCFKKAYTLSDIAILTRSGRQAIKIGKALVKKNIRTGFVDPEGFRDTPEVSLVLAVLRLSEGIDRDKSRAEIRKLLLNEDILALSDRVAKKQNDLAGFPSVEAFAKALRTHSIPDRVNEIITRFDMQGVCGLWGNPDARRGSLNLLRKAAQEYTDKSATLCVEADVRGFLSFLKDWKANEKFDNSAEGVKVLTYHKSKGLDWKIVILCGLDEYKDPADIGGVSPVGESSVHPESLLAIPRLPEDAWVLAKILDNPDSKKVLEHRRAVNHGEEKRLLYVGFTRAKDVVITAAMSTSPQVLAKLCPTVQALQAQGSITPVQDTVDIWGLPGGVVSRYKDCSEDPSVMASNVPVPERYKDAGFSLPVCPAEKPSKYHSPSKYLDKAVQASADVDTATDFGTRMDIPHNHLEDNVFGDCIHHIFALCAPGKHEANLAVAESTLKGYGIKDADAPGKVVACIERFFNWMEEEYGKATSLGQEVPFRYTDRDGRVFSGNMDLVWGLETDCILVDYKTFPGARSELFNRNSEHWAGKYASQLGVYADALSTSVWKTPRFRLLYYPVEGLVIWVKKSDRI